MSESTIDAEVMQPNQAVAVRQESGAIGKALEPENIKAPITAAQAKVEAVAALTMSAYEKAATLVLAPEESSALTADFPDEAFQPGAAGKENLIYIEHAHLRDRFTQVFGMGQWAIIPRNRWAEPFTIPARHDKPASEGQRIYVEAMLVVRGCFVGEAVGAMEYYPKNNAQNYGDAVEGAKTAAFRRCAKEFGVGLQAWKKEWCDGWWQRKRNVRKPTTSAPPAARPEPPAPATPKPATTTAIPFPTDESRAKMITALQAQPGQPNRELVTEYFVKCDIILPTEQLEDIPLRWVPATKGQMSALSSALVAFGQGEQAGLPYQAHAEPSAAKKTIEAPRDPKPLFDGEAWRTFPMPFGKNAGIPLEELEKNYLFGLWANYEVETEYRGKPKSQGQIEKDEQFRAMLDLAGEHYQFTKKD